MKKNKLTGVELIAAERQRQINKEGFGPGHDSNHTGKELVYAAIAYAAPIPLFKVINISDGMAAEIDRLQRIK